MRNANIKILTFGKREKTLWQKTYVMEAVLCVFTLSLITGKQSQTNLRCLQPRFDIEEEVDATTQIYWSSLMWAANWTVTKQWIYSANNYSDWEIPQARRQTNDKWERTCVFTHDFVWHMCVRDSQVLVRKPESWFEKNKHENHFTRLPGLHNLKHSVDKFWFSKSYT